MFCCASINFYTKEKNRTVVSSPLRFQVRKEEQLKKKEVVSEISQRERERDLRLLRIEEKVEMSSSSSSSTQQEMNGRGGGGGEGDLVEITLKTIGPARPSRIQVPSYIKVHDLRSLISADRRLPIEHLKLILRGETLQDSKNGDDVYLRLKNEDSLIVAVKPLPPAKHIRDGSDDEDDEDLKFQTPQLTSWWKRRIFSFLHDKLKLPSILLAAVFSISLKAWLVIILWFALAPVAYRWDLGPLYILGTGFSIILLNLGKRQHGDVSAYSIFNEDFRELPGTLNADRLDRDIRAASTFFFKVDAK